MSRKRFLTLLLLLLLVPFLSCLKKGENPDIPAYLPLATGNWWEYEGIEFYSDGDTAPEILTLRFEVGEKHIIDGKEFFRCQVISDIGFEVWTFYLRAEDKFLLACADTLGKLYNNCENKPPFTIDTLLHHPNFYGGKKWFLRPDRPDDQEGGKAPCFQADYNGEELVGNYNCIKVDYAAFDPDHPEDLEIWNGFYFYEDEEMIDYSFWYGKDVGIVKMEGKRWEREDPEEWDIVRFELENYHMK